MPRPGAALQRSLASLTIGVVRGMEERDDQLAPLRMGNIMQALQVDLKGRVSEKPITGELDIHWPAPFVPDSSRSGGGLETPHWAPGVELLSTSPVIIIAQLTGWHRDTEGSFEGAKIGITAWIPGSKKKQEFSAMLHCTFVGYGAPIEDDEDGVTET